MSRDKAAFQNFYLTFSVGSHRQPIRIPVMLTDMAVPPLPRLGERCSVIENQPESNGMSMTGHVRSIEHTYRYSPLHESVQYSVDVHLEEERQH